MNKHDSLYVGIALRHGMDDDFNADIGYCLDAPASMPAGSMKLDLFGKKPEQALFLREGRFATPAEVQCNVGHILDRLFAFREKRHDVG